jgi:hypothetical protein
MIRRGLTRYEVILRINDDAIDSFYVDGFVSAANCTLAWLRGNAAEAIKEQYKRCMIFAHREHPK